MRDPNDPMSHLTEELFYDEWQSLDIKQAMKRYAVHVARNAVEDCRKEIHQNNEYGHMLYNRVMDRIYAKLEDK